MNIPEKYIELFETCERGELTELEVQDFEARLSYDAEFSEAYAHFRQIESGIQEHYRSELKNRLKELDKTMDGHSTGTSRIRKLVWTGASIAAVLLIGLIVYHNFSADNKYAELAQQHWPVEEGLPVKMSTENKYDKAMNAYKQGQWEVAESELLALPAVDTTQFFLGNVYYKQQELTDASQKFAQIPESSHWYAETRFRLALVLLAQDKTAKAKSLLQEIAASDSPFSTHAAAVLKEI